MDAEITNATKQNLFMELIEDGLKGDKASFEMRARRLASKIKKTSPSLSKEIAGLVSNIGCMRAVHDKSNMPAPVEPDTRQNLLIEEYPVILKREPVWDDSIASELKRFIKERDKIQELLDEGLTPSRSLLMSGPPGVGKTLSANWIARELNLPLLTLDLATVMSSYLGKTGNNIKAVLNYARSFPCVLLLDEFDAIAKKRDDDTDVGELKRLVTVLLQSIDEWPVSSILVAATNHGDLLDPAIWRRFDCVVNFDFPKSAQIKEFSKQWGLAPSIADWISDNVDKTSLAILDKRLNQAKKDAILEEKSLVKALMDVFELDCLPNDDKFRREVVIGLYKKGTSKVKIAEITGINRQKVTSLIKESEMEQGAQGEFSYG